MLLKGTLFVCRRYPADWKLGVLRSTVTLPFIKECGLANELLADAKEKLAKANGFYLKLSGEERAELLQMFSHQQPGL